VAVLVQALGLTPKKIASKGLAKGLNDADVRKIKKALGLLQVA
jgi:hypothetical protein